MSKAVPLALGAAMTLALALPALSDKDSNNSGEGDYALRAELHNPQYIQPGTPYPYPRSYSRGPAYHDPYGPPPAYGHGGKRPYLGPYAPW